jgi:heme oxygenase
MSTTVIPSGAVGIWRVAAIDLDAAKNLIADGFVSAIGHESTAQVMTELLQREVVASRITVEPEPGDSFVCFKLHSRPPEGAILDRAALDAVGYSWCLMTYESC